MNQSLHLAAALAVCMPCLTAQFQASNETARRIGLAVDVIPTNVASPNSQLTITAPSGAPILIYLDNVFTSDVAYGYGSPLAEPSHIELQYHPVTGAPLFVDITQMITGEQIYFMPDNQCTASFNLPTPIPGIPGITIWDIQAFMLVSDPASTNGVAISNGVRRTLTNVVGTNYTTPGIALPGSFNDIEQGDIDGDGDLDTVLVTCGGAVQVFTNIAGVIPVAPQLITIPGVVTSCELADLNNDNYLDLVVSQGGTLGGWVINQGRPAPAAGQTQLGAWNGFGAFNRFQPAPGLGPTNGNDIETADVDSDGDLDVVIACGLSPTLGEQNRLLLNTLTQPGVVGFADVTAALNGPTYPRQFDDSEDIEFFDLDGDKDYDIVVGNFDGPAGITGVDFFLVNQGGAQGGTAGVFGAPTAFPGALNDETLDVVVGDLNGDGAPDVYVGNWYQTQTNQGGPPFGAPLPDVLYLTTNGVPLVWTNQSALLPDNPNYNGPNPVLPAPTADAEIADYDLDGDLDIFVPIGRKCLGAAPPATGMYLFHSDLAQNGVFSLRNDPFNWLPGLQFDHSDIEMGDYATLFHDQDFGAATLTGSYSATRN